MFLFLYVEYIPCVLRKGTKEALWTGLHGRMDALEEINAFELRDHQLKQILTHAHTNTSLSSPIPYAESRVREF